MGGIIEFIIDSKDYFIHLLILIGIYIILAQSFNLNFGVGSLFNLAHGAVWAVGAYTTALLSTEHGLGFWICVPLSMILSGTFALLLGGISLKLKQDYFAIGTLAFFSVVSALLINWKSLTRGVLGIPGIPRPEIFGLDFYQSENFLYLTYISVLFVLIVLYSIFKSPYARTLRAQAEFEHAAQALAKHTSRARIISFVVSSAFAGLAGALFAYYINYIDPSSFSLQEMVLILTIVVVGRPGSFWGCVFATAFLLLLPEPLRFTGNVPEWIESLAGAPISEIREIPIIGFVVYCFVEVMEFISSPNVLGPMRQMLYAVIMFAVVFINRERLFPRERRV